jgi:predicted amidohydrolase
MREVKVATAQFETTLDPDENRRKALRYCDEAAHKGAQAICLAEFWMTGNPTTGDNSRLVKLVEPIPGPTFKLFEKKAKELGIYIIPGTIIEKDEDGRYYNTSGLISPSGKLIAKLRKDHPENASGKAETHFGINPGPGEYPVFDTEIGVIGVPIDMDLCALEVPRIMGLKGAEILFTPMCWGATVHDCVAAYGIAGSSVSDAYVVIANRMSQDPVRLGGSGVFWLRNYIARIPDLTEGLTVATIDLDRVKERREECRTRYPYWRRPSTYGLLLDEEAERQAHGLSKTTKRK